MNIGCGQDYREGWVNLDLHEADIIADANKPLPFPNNHFEEVLANSIIEHLDIGFFEFVTEVKRILKPNGFFRFNVPNCFNWKSRIKYLFGEFPASSGYHYDHRWLYKPSFIVAVLEAQGFEVKGKHSDLFDADIKIVCRKRM